jgi:aryl-alcohol dehydrogenase-like predicted oxidoreductase
MKKRMLANGLEVSAVGMGCMGLSHGYGPATNRGEALHLIQEAVGIGYTFFDTAEIYGQYINEEIVGEALEKHKGKVVIATKFGIAAMNDTTGDMVLDSSPNAIKKSVEGSLNRLKVDCIDLYYQHRQDPNTPVEAVAQTMKDLIEEGKIRHWGLSAVDSETIRKAHTICPVTAVQSEYSMMYRKLEKDVLPACEELGISLVPYSPLGNGFLTGKYTKNSKYPQGDLRNIMRRYKPEAMNKNQALLDFIVKTAEDKQVTPAQIALAWVMARNPHVVPIPGMRKVERLRENAKSADVEFSKEEYANFNKLLAEIEILEINF